MSDRSLDWAVQLVIAEEAANLLAERMKRLVRRPPSLMILDLKDVLVQESMVVLEKADCAGEIEELVLRSDGREYYLELATDTIDMARSFSDFEDLSEMVDAIAAFKDGDEYVLHLERLSWTKFCTVRVRADKPIVFKRVFVRYKVY